MEEGEEEIEIHINNITMNTSFQSPISMNAQKKVSNVSLERRLAPVILSETSKNSKYVISNQQSTILDIMSPMNRLTR